jgi:hypothetical protein
VENTVHFDTSRLTPLGWALFIASWLSFAGLAVLGFIDAPKVFLIIDVCIFFGALLVTAILDYAGDAVHRPRPRDSRSEADALASPEKERGRGV